MTPPVNIPKTPGENAPDWTLWTPLERKIILLIQRAMQDHIAEQISHIEQRGQEKTPRELNLGRIRIAGARLADMAQEIIGLVDPCLERRNLEVAIDEFEKEFKI